MKSLNQYCIEVTTPREREAAIYFYRKASKRPYYKYSDNEGPTVGMGINTRGIDARNTVVCGSRDPHETMIPFKDMILLADTPARLAAFKATQKKYPITIPEVKEIKEIKEIKEKKTPSKMLPVVEFRYPKHNAEWPGQDRCVRVVKYDANNLLGFDVNDNEKFKRFKASRILSSVRLVRFNS